MRYQSIGTFTFTDVNGKEFIAKKFRKVEKLSTLFEIPVNNVVFFDEIASRNDVYGQDSETKIYKLVDHNLKQLFSNNFNTTKISRVKIPK